MKIFQPKPVSPNIPITNIGKKRFVLKAEDSKVKKSTMNDELRYLNNGVNVKICIYRACGGLGDILMITPLLRVIKETYPLCQLTFAIDTKTAGDNYYNLIKNNPYIDEIVSAHTVKKDSYHLFKDISSVCLQYENSGLPPINRIDIFAKSCGFQLTSPKPYYRVEEDEKIWASNLFDKISKGKKDKYKFIMLHTASYDNKRTWPIHKYTELISLLNKERSDIFYLINDFQRLNPYWDKMRNTYEVSSYGIRELCAITERVDLFVGPDSGPMHIAGALNTPGIALFGSIAPQARINHYPSFEALTVKNLACMPCYYKPCPFNIKCMTSLEAAMVSKKVLEKL